MGGVTKTLPEVGLLAGIQLPAPEALQDVAFVELHVSFEDSPWSMIRGFAESETALGVISMTVVTPLVVFEHPQTILMRQVVPSMRNNVPNPRVIELKIAVIRMGTKNSACAGRGKEKEVINMIGTTRKIAMLFEKFECCIFSRICISVTRQN